MSSLASTSAEEAKAVVRRAIQNEWNVIPWASQPWALDYIPPIYWPGMKGDPGVERHHAIVQFTPLKGRSVGFTEGVDRLRAGGVATLIYRYPLGMGDYVGDRVGQRIVDALMRKALILRPGTHTTGSDGEVRAMWQHRVTFEFNHDRFTQTA